MHDKPSPLRRFLQLTDKTVPVPLMLTEFDDRIDEAGTQRALKERELLDEFDDYGMRLMAAPPAADASAEPPFVATCFTGGSDILSANYCDERKGTWNCDNDAWVNLTRSR